MSGGRSVLEGFLAGFFIANGNSHSLRLINPDSRYYPFKMVCEFQQGAGAVRRFVRIFRRKFASERRYVRHNASVGFVHAISAHSSVTLRHPRNRRLYASPSSARGDHPQTTAMAQPWCKNHFPPTV